MGFNISSQPGGICRHAHTFSHLPWPLQHFTLFLGSTLPLLALSLQWRHADPPQVMQNKQKPSGCKCPLASARRNFGSRHSFMKRSLYSPWDSSVYSPIFSLSSRCHFYEWPTGYCSLSQLSGIWDCFNLLESLEHKKYLGQEEEQHWI